MMLKTKVTVELEIEQTDELGPDWQESIKTIFTTLDQSTVHFSESQGVMNITDIKVEK